MAGFSNDIMYADNVNFAGGKTATVTSDGQLLIGDSSSPNIKVGTLTSPDGSVTIGYSSPNITLQAAGGSTKAIVLAYLNASLANATGDGTVLNPLIFESAPVNITSSYNTTTGIFTAPVTGNYLVSVNITYNNLLASHIMAAIQFVRVSTGTFQQIIFNPGLNGTSITGYTPGTFTATLSGIVSLTAGDEFQINTLVNNSTKTVGIEGSNFAYNTSLSISQL